MRALRLRVKALLLACLSLAAFGCGSLLEITRTAPTPIPLEPRTTPELRESVSRQTAYAGDVLARVKAAGAEAGNSAVRQAEQAARFVESAVGAPVHRIEVGVDESGRPLPAPDYKEVLEQAQTVLAEARQAWSRYRRSLDAARAEQMGRKSRTEVSSGWLRWLSGLGWTGVLLGAALVTFLVPNRVLVLLARSAVETLRAVLREAALRATGTLEQVVEGVQRAKGRMDPRSTDALRKELRRTTTPESRRAIAHMKEKVKDELQKEEQING
ncbi:MAG: hypothetical protein R6X33_08950 [Candidatus Brocadiia bacterium]